MKKQTRRIPSSINENTWFYSSSRGVELVYEIFVGDRYIRTDVIKIPWKKIKSALNRQKNSKELSGGK